MFFVGARSAPHAPPPPGPGRLGGYWGEKGGGPGRARRPAFGGGDPPYCTLETLRYDISFCGGPFPEFHRVERAVRRPDWPSDETMGDSAGRTRPSTMLR